MSIALIAGIAVIILIAVIALTQRSGPRITTIERRREEQNENDDRNERD